METRELKAKLELEKKNIHVYLDELCAFKQSDEFYKATTIHQYLIERQYNALVEYLRYVNLRIDLIKETIN